MNKRLGIFIGIFLLAVASTSFAHAIELNVSGNGEGSSNSINFQNNSNTTVEQTNQGSVTNDINASANTGGNNTNGGSVNTGDASIFVKIKNFFNSNNADVDCCPEGVTPTPTVFDPSQPTPTPTTPGGVGGPPSNGDGNGGNGGNGGGVGGPPAGGGQVQGLSAASGESTLEIFFYTLGTLCLAAGINIVRGSKKIFE